MTKEACYNDLDQFPGYTCSEDLCKGNDCVCKYKEQPCKDNGCQEKTEGECVSKDKCLERAAIGMKCDENLCGKTLVMKANVAVFTKHARRIV